MIIAIDETGSFRPKSRKFSFFIAIHLRESGSLLKDKENQYHDWESSLPKSLKNHRGEIKGNALSEEQLLSFVRDVILKSHYVGITPIRFRPIENTENVISDHKTIQLAGINDVILQAQKANNSHIAKTYRDFANWFRNLNYQQYMKIFLLGMCIVDGLRNTIGHAISGGYDNELVDIKYLIDKDFLKGKEQDIFWHELLRNQLYSFSQQDPINLLNTWKETGHPFVDKYASSGYFDLNKIFWDNSSFVESHDNFQIRIADIVCSILSRRYNSESCKIPYNYLKKCFLKDGKIHHVILNRVDIDTQFRKKTQNPWEHLAKIDELKI